MVAAATEQRPRAFTLLLLRTYEEARSAIGYLRRREGDAESIAPSLWANKGRRKVTEAATDTPAWQPAANSPTPVGTTTATLPAITPAQAAAAVAAQKGAPASKDPFLS